MVPFSQDLNNTIGPENLQTTPSFNYFKWYSNLTVFLSSRVRVGRKKKFCGKKSNYEILPREIMKIQMSYVNSAC